MALRVSDSVAYLCVRLRIKGKNKLNSELSCLMSRAPSAKAVGLRVSVHKYAALIQTFSRPTCIDETKETNSILFSSMVRKIKREKEGFQFGSVFDQILCSLSVKCINSIKV